MGGREPRAGVLQQIQSLVSRRKSRDMLSWVSEVAVYTGKQLGFSRPQIRMTTISSRSMPSEVPSLRKLCPGRSGEPCGGGTRATGLSAGSILGPRCAGRWAGFPRTGWGSPGHRAPLFSDAQRTAPAPGRHAVPAGEGKRSPRQVMRAGAGTQPQPGPWRRAGGRGRTWLGRLASK